MVKNMQVGRFGLEAHDTFLPVSGRGEGYLQGVYICSASKRRLCLTQRSPLKSQTDKVKAESETWNKTKRLSKRYIGTTWGGGKGGKETTHEKFDSTEIKGKGGRISG